MVFLIIISPLAFRIHEYIPNGEGAILSILGFEIDANGFVDLPTYIWFLVGKLVPLSLLIIWFLTCKHWWYHIILIPVLMYSFQIFEVVYSEDKYVDTENILWLLPVCIVLIPFVYFIRIKLYDKYVHGIDLEAIDAELEVLKSKKEIQQVDDIDIPEDDLKVLNPESIADELNRKLSTRNLELGLKQIQRRLQNILHLNSK